MPIVFSTANFQAHEDYWNERCDHGILKASPYFFSLRDFGEMENFITALPQLGELLELLAPLDYPQQTLSVLNNYTLWDSEIKQILRGEAKNLTTVPEINKACVFLRDIIGMSILSDVEEEEIQRLRNMYMQVTQDDKRIAIITQQYEEFLAKLSAYQ